jgi:hypothetical protein
VYEAARKNADGQWVERERVKDELYKAKGILAHFEPVR